MREKIFEKSAPPVPPPAVIRVLIADDHPIFRRGLRQTIESDPRLQVVAEAADGAEVLAQIEQTAVQVAVLDIDMPVLDGFAVARQLAARNSPVAVIFLTMHRDEHFLNAALDLGVRGYVLKDNAIADLVNSIRAVAAGQNYISPQFSTYLLNRARQPAGPSPSWQRLTPTERKVLKLLAVYRTSREIADELCLSPRTIENHRAHIAEKLGLKGAHALLKFAIENQSHL